MKIKIPTIPIIGFWLLSTGCMSPEPPPSPMPAPSIPLPPPDESLAPDVAALCRATIAQHLPRSMEVDARLEPFERNLPLIQVFSRTHPLLYLRKPRQAEDEDAAAIRASFPDTHRARTAVRKVLKEFHGNYETLRHIFLSEGYLFEDRFQVARAFVKELSLAQLFEEPTIYIHRRGIAEPLTRENDEYVDTDKQRVKLVLGSRVATTPEALALPLHLDIDTVATATGARRVIPVRIFAAGAQVTLVYPNDTRIDAFLTNRGTETIVACHMADDNVMAEAQKDAATFWEWIASLKQAAQLMVAERPDFDEPENEPDTEQEDGKLRIEWEKSYRRGKRVFTYRELEYDVYDRSGNPTPPQVCIDFIIDTWERASGNWYKPRRQRPGRTNGYLDFNEIEALNTRHTSSVLGHANEPESPFQRMDFSRRTHAPYRHHRKFANAIAHNAAHIREGDMLVIHGLREEDMKDHFHTVMVLATYPVTGIPAVLADNAGRPQIRTLSSAMRSAPRRSIKHRIRLDWDWMRQRKKRSPTK